MQNTMAIWMLNFIKELRYGRMTLVSFDKVFQQFDIRTFTNGIKMSAIF
jgi:hypothetical protein